MLQPIHSTQEPLHFLQPGERRSQIVGEGSQFLKRAEAESIVAEDHVALNHGGLIAGIDVERLGRQGQRESETRKVERLHIQRSTDGVDILDQIHPFGDEPGRNVAPFLVRHVAEDSTCTHKGKDFETCSCGSQEPYEHSEGL